MVSDEIADTRILTTSPGAPALPFVTGARKSAEELLRLRAALEMATAVPRLADVRGSLRLAGISILPKDDYLDAFAEGDRHYSRARAIASTSMTKSSCTSRSTISRVLGGYFPSGNRVGKSAARSSMNSSMSWEWTM